MELRIGIVAWAALMLLGALTSQCGSTAGAQEIAFLGEARVGVANQNDADVLVLSQTCVAELSLQRGTKECVLMMHKQEQKAERRGIPLVQQVIEFHQIHKRIKHGKKRGQWRRNEPRHRWIRGLRLNGSKPKAWRDGIDGDWAKCRGAWLSIVAAVRAFLRGETLDPCPKAQDYGGNCDDVRGACDPPGPRHVRVDCGDTAQAYWRIIPKGKTLPASVAAGGATEGVW